MKTAKLTEDEMLSIVCDACRIYRHEVLVYPETARTPEKFAHDYVLHMTAANGYFDDVKEEKETK